MALQQLMQLSKLHPANILHRAHGPRSTLGTRGSCFPSVTPDPTLSSAPLVAWQLKTGSLP